MYRKILSILSEINLDENGIYISVKGNPPTLDGTGYLVFKKNGTKFQVHQVVAVREYSEKCLGLTVNHKNGDKQNNSPSNLEVISLSDNAKHAHTTGLAVYGKQPEENKIKVKLTDFLGNEYYFDSIYEASQELKLDASNLRRSLDKPTRSCQGYKITTVGR